MGVTLLSSSRFEIFGGPSVPSNQLEYVIISSIVFLPSPYEITCLSYIGSGYNSMKYWEFTQISHDLC